MYKIAILNQNLFENSKKISFFLFLLLISFVSGNLFGLYLKQIEDFYFNLFLNLIFIELISFLKYSKKIPLYNNENNFLIKSLNVLKRGFLIGIFVEAFKVGS